MTKARQAPAKVGRSASAHSRSAKKRSLIAPTKTSAPRLEGIYPRTRLYKLLDQARTRPVVWIEAPAGSGKTILAASYIKGQRLRALWYQFDARDADPAVFFYRLREALGHLAPRKHETLPLLTPEYYLGLPTFVRNFFEAVYQRLKPPAVLVFDNFQDLPEDALLQQFLPVGLGILPEGINILILSRNGPPPAFAPLEAARAVSRVAPESLMLAADEMAGFAKPHGFKQLTLEAANNLHLRTRGWVAGAVLLLEQAVRQNLAMPQFDQTDTAVVFDYFAAEIMQQLDEPTRDFLLQSALLPQFTVELAGALTGNPKSGEILRSLARRNFFVTAHAGPPPSYEFHPFFREFLQQTLAQHLSAGDLRAAQIRAAQALAGAGQIADAVPLWAQAGDWDALAEALRRQAPAMLELGQAHSLEAWINLLPGNIRGSDPWLLYYLGLSRLPFGPEAVRPTLERAYHVFGEHGDEAGVLLAWCAIIDTFVYAWGDMHPLDRWIEALEQRLLQHPQFSSKEIEARVACAMFTALMYRQPDHPQMKEWTEKARQIVHEGGDARLRMYVGPQLLFFESWWTGELARAGCLVETLRPLTEASGVSPLTATAWTMMSAVYFWMMAENTKAVQAADHGLRLAEESGVHVMDIWTCGQALFATLTEGDLAAAKGYLDRVAPIEQPDRLIDSGLYHHLRAWYHLLNEERIVAADHARFSVEVVERAGSPFHLAHACTVYGTVLHVLGQSDEGLRRLAQARSIGQALESGTVMYCSWIAEAEIHLNLGSESQALEALRRAFEIGRRCGFRNHTWWRADAMARLYAKALVHDIETEYVTAQIWRRHLTPRGLPEADLEHWSFPIKIYTFGRFSILVNGRPHNLTSQKKPIGLLKAIIVLGGNEVDEDRLLELLWPDAEGDSARQNLKITLHRLRKFLPDEAIRWENGQLGLDPDTVWVDRWVFERLLDKLDTTLQQRKPEATALGDRAFALYGGAFLTDDDAPWILSSRERLRDKLLRLLHRLGETMFMQHHYREALTYYEKGIEIDPLAERFYQDLMHCHQLLKQPADGLRVYRRCHDILKRELGVSPSPRTEALREALQTG